MICRIVAVLLLGISAGCSFPVMAAGDKLKIVGVEPGDRVAVIWRGLSDTGCKTTYERIWSTGEVDLPNLVPSDGHCPAEIAVFSEKHAMAYEVVTTWTSQLGDIHTITLTPLIIVPISVWTTNDEEKSRAQKDMDAATDRYLKNRTGIRFQPTYHNVPSAVVQKFIDSQCQAHVEIQNSGFYIPGRLNVYYFDAPNISGQNCAIVRVPRRSGVDDTVCKRPEDMPPAADANIIYIGRRNINEATLAHEIGHAFGLRPAICGGHTQAEETPEFKGLFDKTNIMWAAGGNDREFFTLGQAFQINMRSDRWGGTMLIKNGLRPGPGINCWRLGDTDWLVQDAICPALPTPWPH
jgi:hypothetical protein